MLYSSLLSALLLTFVINTASGLPQVRVTTPGTSERVTLKFATLNVLNSKNKKQSTPPDAPWPMRRGPLMASIVKANPDVIGLQEPIEKQVNQLQEGLEKSHTCIAKQVANKLENLIMCYKTEKVELLEMEYFWLSKTPKKKGSKGWDAKLSRMAQVGKFKIISSGETFWAVNTHFDHVGARARQESAKLVLKRLRSKIQGKETGYKPLVVVLGDLNAGPDDDTYHTMTGDRYLTEDQSMQNIKLNTFIDLERSHGAELKDITAAGNKQSKRAHENYHIEDVIDYILVADNGAIAKDCWRPGNVKRVSNVFKKKSKEYRYSDHEMLVAEVIKG